MLLVQYFTRTQDWNVNFMYYWYTYACSLLIATSITLRNRVGLRKYHSIVRIPYAILLPWLCCTVLYFTVTEMNNRFELHTTRLVQLYIVIVSGVGWLIWFINILYCVSVLQIQNNRWNEKNLCSNNNSVYYEQRRTIDEQQAVNSTQQTILSSSTTQE